MTKRVRLGPGQYMEGTHTIRDFMYRPNFKTQYRATHKQVLYGFRSKPGSDLSTGEL